VDLHLFKVLWFGNGISSSLILSPNYTELIGIMESAFLVDDLQLVDFEDHGWWIRSHSWDEDPDKMSVADAAFYRDEPDLRHYAGYVAAHKNLAEELGRRIKRAPTPVEYSWIDNFCREKFYRASFPHPLFLWEYSINIGFHQSKFGDEVAISCVECGSKSMDVRNLPKYVKNQSFEIDRSKNEATGEVIRSGGELVYRWVCPTCQHKAF